MRNTASQQKRATKSYSIDQGIHAYVVRTRGSASASERVNGLLRRAIEDEQDAELEREAAEFFSAVPQTARREAKAFERAAKRSLARD